MRTVKSFKQMDTKVLECRSLRHGWTHKRTVIEKGGVIRLEFRCMRCPTQRIDNRARTSGALLTRSYHHPDGYLVEDIDNWGGRKTFNANVTKELVDRYVRAVRK